MYRCDAHGKEFKSAQGLAGHNLWVHGENNGLAAPDKPTYAEQLKLLDTDIELLNDDTEQLNERLERLESAAGGAQVQTLEQLSQRLASVSEVVSQLVINATIQSSDCSIEWEAAVDSLRAHGAHLRGKPCGPGCQHRTGSTRLN